MSLENGNNGNKKQETKKDYKEDSEVDFDV